MTTQLPKYLSKIYGLNFEIVDKTWDLRLDRWDSTKYQIFLIQIAFQSSDRAELAFWGSVINIALNFKSRGTEKIELSSQGTYNFQILGNETLIIADYKHAEISKFAMVDIML